MDRRRQDPFQLVLSAALLALAACATARPSLPPRSPERLVSAPGAAAPEYRSDPPAGAAIEDDAARTLQHVLDQAQRTRRQQLRGDPRLRQLAGWVADHLGSDGSLPLQAALDLAAEHLGLPEPTPHVVVIASDDRAEVQQRLRADLSALFAEHDYSHFGAVARKRGELTVYVVTLVFRFVELTPVPRSVAAGGELALRGRLTHGYSAPELAITRPDGNVERSGPSSTGPDPSFAFGVKLPQPGVYRIELLGQGPLGIAVVANFPIYVGQTPPERIELSAPETAVSSPEQAAARLLQLTNAERKKQDLPPLAFDPALSRVARAHVSDMLAHGFVGHTSPSTGSASDRVARAGIRTSLVLENIGRGYSVSELHAGLMQSPGHRANLLNPEATNIGIAVAVGDDGGHPVYLATELFVRVTPKLGPDANHELLDQINNERARRGAAALSGDAQLASIAQRAANGCMRGAHPSDAAALQVVHSELEALGARSDRIAALLSMASSLSDLSRLDAVLDPHASSIGLAVVQGTRPDTAPNALCAVLLLAQ